MTDKKKDLIGIVIISWYFRVVGLIMFFLGIVLLFLERDILNEVILETMPYLSFLGGGVSIVVGIFSILVGIVYFFVSRSLSKLKHWARITVIVLSILQIIVALVSTFNGNFGSISSLIIPGIILYYILKKDVRERFLRD